MKNKIFSILILTTIILAGFRTDVSAFCSTSFPTHTWDTTPILGTVKTKTKIGDGTNFETPAEFFKYTFSVDRSWKRVTEHVDIELTDLGNIDGLMPRTFATHDNGYKSLEVGKQYLVFTTKSNDKVVPTDECKESYLSSQSNVKAYIKNYLDEPLPNIDNSKFNYIIRTMYTMGAQPLEFLSFTDPNISDDGVLNVNYPMAYNEFMHVNRNQLVFMLFGSFGLDLPADTNGNFADVDTNTDLGKMILKLKQMNVIDGYTDGKFHGERTVTRGEATKMVVNLMIKLGDIEMSQTNTTIFSDVNANNKFITYISTLASTYDTLQEPVISGYSDGTFRSENVITSGQASKIAYLAGGYAEAPH